MLRAVDLQVGADSLRAMVGATFQWGFGLGVQVGRSYATNPDAGVGP